MAVSIDILATETYAFGLSLWQLLPLLTGAAFLAGLVDSIAGGGGLITVPVLLAVGLEPVAALGTNKLQASFGSGSATLHYAHGRAVKLNDTLPGVGITFLSASAGALTVQYLPQDLLRAIIPFLLLALVVYILLRPKLGLVAGRPRMGRWAFYLIGGAGIGFYDGFFGPGTGSFWTMAFVLLQGMDLRRAVAHTKVLNFTSNIAALLLFLLGGHVRVIPGAAMGLGQLLGARVGSRLVLRRGAVFVRPVFLIVVVLTSAKLFYDWFLGG